jgi:hypothetical protein
MKRLILNLSVGLIAGSFFVTAARAVSYNNSTSSEDIIYFGNPNTATYGQTFTAPSANVLNDWTFYLKNDGSTAQNFEFFLMAWDGSKATGSILYQSGLKTVATSQNTYTPFSVAPDVTLTSGQKYVMFINESGLNGGVDGQIGMGGNSNVSPLGGSFLFLNNGDTFGNVSTDPWDLYSVPETAYTADFSDSLPASVPDAANSMFLMSLALGGLAGMRRWFGRRSTAA